MKAARLLKWYDKHGRDLPWRNLPAGRQERAYRVLVSEIMLQQTQVPRVLIFYEKWLGQFPDWKTLAQASHADVIRAWSGLGYNRRALMLKNIAQEIATKRREMGNNWPGSESQWRELKGIGPYTAAAIAAFAHKQRTIPIDTNIRRVLGRLLLGVPYPTPAHDDRIRKAADDFLPLRGRFYDIPQALFDIATAICTKTPRCAECPMWSTCPAAKKFLSGRVKTPKAMIKKSHETRHRGKPYPDRIYRGRILKLASTPRGTAVSSVGPAIDPSFDRSRDTAWVLSMIKRLNADGLLQLHNGRISLPRV